jgi:amino-acid N-acetyltransferase
VQTVELRPAEPRDREYVEQLLAENGLPTSDLDSAYSSLFVCESANFEPSAGESPDGEPPEGERVGVGGLEVEGDAEDAAGLLRSVAVEESARGAGYGTAICERLLDRARADDLDSVFLLTTTAEGFFADLGFQTVEREQVPDPIRGTAEFSDLCPASATCMKRSLNQS